MTLTTPAPSAPLDAVEWRVDGKPSNNKSRFVPYLDAKTVASLLDEWVGPFNWQDAYEPAPGKGLWCHLSIRGVIDIQTGHSEWVTKTDIGVPSNFESEKGQVSDAFKRAATLKWGVGRNVYDLPTLWAPVDVKRNAKNEDVAWPNDKTMPSIRQQLKALGFETDGGKAAAYHDDEADKAPDETVVPEGWVDADECMAAHDEIAATIKASPDEAQTHLREWRREKKLPWPMSRTDLDVMWEEVAAATKPADDAQAKAERLRQKAAENAPDDVKANAAKADA